MSDALTMLAEIPGLAAEAFATWGAPNPGDESGRTRRPAPGSKPPADLHRLVALAVPGEDDPDRHDHGDGRLMLELLLAVRMVAEEWPEAVPDWPSHDWVSVCRWLNDTANLWRCDQFAAGWVADSVARAWRGLRELCRVPREVILRCNVPTPGGWTCGARLHVETESVARCESGHEVSHRAAIKREISLQNKPLGEALRTIAYFWGVQLPPYEVAKKWAQRGRFGEPERRDGKRLYNVGAIVKAIEHGRVAS